MLTLNKRYLRNVKKNFSFYLFSTLLTVIAICLFLCFHAGINGEKTYLEEFRSASCVEDGEFTLPAALTTEDISEMESKLPKKKTNMQIMRAVRTHSDAFQKQKK